MKVGVARVGEQKRWIVKPGSHQAIRDGRQDRRGGHVTGDVGLRVVGPVVLLVHVLLEDVAEHIGVDLVVVPMGMLIEVPAPPVEELEQVLEGAVGNPQAVPVARLDLVHLEHAAVDERHRADESCRGRILGLSWVAEPFVEQRQQEMLPVGVFGAFALRELSSCDPQSASQVLGIAVEKAPLLDEIDEHQPVQQHRGVPVAVGAVIDAFDAPGKRAVMLGELPEEASGDLLGVERAPYPVENGAGGERGFFADREGRPLEPLQHSLAGRFAGIDVIHQAVADAAGALLGPQPQMPLGGHEHHELVSAGPPQHADHPVLFGPLRQAAWTVDAKCCDALLVGKGRRGERAVCWCRKAERRRVVPAQLADEQSSQVALDQQSAQSLGRHLTSLSRCERRSRADSP